MALRGVSVYHYTNRTEYRYICQSRVIPAIGDVSVSNTIYFSRVHPCNLGTGVMCITDRGRVTHRLPEEVPYYFEIPVAALDAVCLSSLVTHNFHIANIATPFLQLPVGTRFGKHAEWPYAYGVVDAEFLPGEWCCHCCTIQ